MKIAVIGASGEVGFRLVQRFCLNHQLICIVRNKKKKDFSKLSNIALFEISDVSKTQELSSALNNVDVVINAGYIFFAQHIFAAINCLESKPKHIIFTGSTGVFTKLPSFDADLKRDAELFIEKKYDVPWTIIRPTMIYGHTHDRNISRAIKFLNMFPLLPVIGKGQALIQPVFIDDVIKAFEIAILNSKLFSKAFNIAGEKPLTNRQLFKAICKALNKKVYFISINPKVFSLVIRVLSIFRLEPINQEQILRFQEDKDIELLSFIKNFNFTPRSFEKGIDSLIEEMKLKK